MLQSALVRAANFVLRNVAKIDQSGESDTDVVATRMGLGGLARGVLNKTKAAGRIIGDEGYRRLSGGGRLINQTASRQAQLGKARGGRVPVSK